MENKELKQTIVNERTGIEYNLVGDYYITNIVLPKPRRTGTVEKYGRMSSFLHSTFLFSSTSKNE